MAVTFCDPGIVTVADLDAHNALYPADGVLFQKDRHCTACGQARPARAKHCNATKRCVARFDHWCIWVNAPIGLYNTRWFLAFLLVTMCACAYGAVAVFVVVHAEMTERRAWDLVWRDGRTGVRTRLGDSWRLQATYVAANFGPLAGVGIFLGFAACIVAGFTTLQLYRIATGITTNEGFRLKDLKLSSSANKVSAVKHPYSRGWRRNFAEILLPHMHLEHARKELRRQQ